MCEGQLAKFSPTFLYISDKLTEKEIKRAVLLTVPSIKIKYLGINGTMEMKKNCSTLKKRDEEDSKNSKIRKQQNDQISHILGQAEQI